MMKPKLMLLIGIFLGWSSVPAQTPKSELIFSHQLHQAQEMSCADCHAAADSSRLAMDNLLPTKETCANCHDVTGECKMCHRDPDKASVSPRITTYIAKFPHVKHVKSTPANCSACHAGIEKSQDVQTQHLPAMQNCSSCHKDFAKPNYCYDCHAPTDELRPGDHRTMPWKQQHGMVSQTNLLDCTACHTTQACITCHQGDNLDHKVHGLNYRFQHGLHAKGNKTTCITCHEEASFCNDCHRTQMVMPRSHAAANWSNRKTGGGHARAAKLDLDTCISCHADTKAQPICIQCHHQ